MFDRYFRVALVLATLVVSVQVAAAPRYWTFSGVQFDDGAVATGYLTYDDATRMFTDWNVRVSMWHSPFIGNLEPPGFTYVPGNSEVYQYPGDPGFGWFFGFVAQQDWVAQLFPREFAFRTPKPLDATDTPVSLARDNAWEGLTDTPICGCEPWISRNIIAGSLEIMPLPPPVKLAQVDEFYHPGLRRYFITADPAEKAILDSGIHPGWERTGESFKAYATGSRGGRPMNPVCRYYGLPERGLDSHFYSADAGECWQVHILVPRGAQRGDWHYESDNVFQIDLPDTATGACADGTSPVYRLWSKSGASHHRYTTSRAIKAQMLAAGYLAEGYGPDSVVMCAVQ